MQRVEVDQVPYLRLIYPDSESGSPSVWSLLSNSETFGDKPIPFQVPWVALAVLAVAVLGASLAAVYAPAAKASRIRPAAALRIAD
jgi:ABC-type lipoprotein release transport system permease subunit